MLITYKDISIGKRNLYQFQYEKNGINSRTDKQWALFEVDVHAKKERKAVPRVEYHFNKNEYGISF